MRFKTIALSALVMSAFFIPSPALAKGLDVPAQSGTLLEPLQPEQEIIPLSASEPEDQELSPAPTPAQTKATTTEANPSEAKATKAQGNETASEVKTTKTKPTDIPEEVAFMDAMPEEIPAIIPTPTPVATPSPSPTPNMIGNELTPDGQGSVIDNATENDGKEFFTVTTQDGNVFYLIIDRQRNSQNVYFLNAVTEADLKALAEHDGFDMGELEPTPVPERTPVPVATPQPIAEPEPEKTKSGIGGIVILLLVVAGVVGAGYYFKI